MQKETKIEKRNRALIAFAILSGARDKALISYRLKHIDIERGLIERPHEKFALSAKTFTTWFFPVGDDIQQIVTDWVDFLREEKCFRPDGPLFPKTKVAKGDDLQFRVVSIDREHERHPFTAHMPTIRDSSPVPGSTRNAGFEIEGGHSELASEAGHETDRRLARIEVISRAVTAESKFVDFRDGGRGIETVGVSGGSASSSGGLNTENLQYNQPHAPGRRRRFYLAVHGWRVSVRSLHLLWVVQLRGVSGFFAAWRSSGEFETFREQCASVLVADPHRSLASKRAGPGEVLSSAWSDDDNVRSLAELPGRQGSGSQAYGNIRPSCVVSSDARLKKNAGRARPLSFWREPRMCAVARSRRSGRCTSRR